MTVGRTYLLALALLAGGPVAADETGGKDVRFAAPRRIQSGDAILGAGRYFPSPVLHDVDGDGTLDIVVGDLVGAVTYARRTKDGVGAEAPLEGRDGKQLRFHNW